MMNKNMNSPTKLTEFAPLSPEDNQPVVASIFSKLFSFGKMTTGSETPAVSPKEEDRSSSGDSESWKQLDSLEKTPEDDTSTHMSFPLDASEGRSLPNVLKRISNIVASKSSSLKSYKDSQLRSFWMPDSVAKQCYECTERFTTFRRRHHCRVCGQIFCSKCCSDEIPGKIMGCTGDLRVCTYCCKVVLSYLQSSDMRSVLSADLKALQEDLQVKYGSDIPSPHQKAHIQEDETTVHRKPSVGYMEEKYALSRSSGSYLSPHERSIVLQNSASLRMIWEELFNSSQSIPLQTHWVRLKNYYNCFTGVELVNWMISQNKAATRIQATAIGQALLEAGFIKSVQGESTFTDTPSLFIPVSLSSLQSSNFSEEHQSSCDAQEPAWVKNIPQHDSTTDSESETRQVQPSVVIGRLPSSSSSFYLDLNLEASTVTLKRPTCEDFSAFPPDPETPTADQKDMKQRAQECAAVSDEVLNDTLFHVQETKERNSWHKVNNLRNSFGEMSAYNSLSAAYKQHEDSLIKQLLNKEGLSQKWSDVIIPIAHQIVDQLRPDLNHDAEDMDIRQYVQIKKSPGGSKNDCEIVSGVVCSKNVAHRGMNAMIAHPKILLLQCGLMYQRVEGKLLSLEPVMMQENEYLGQTVARITALGPDIVLVHRSVSRLAQDRFRQCGVTLVLNVKLSVLERVARCTGGTIVNTIDAHLTARYKLGACNKFYLRNFPGTNKSGIKTLMYFEGCANPHLGSTILLRGGSPGELKRVKNVTSTMIFAVYSWRLEKSFLMDEFARPPSLNDNSFLDGDHSRGEEGRRLPDSGVAEDPPTIQEDQQCSESTSIKNQPIGAGLVNNDKFKKASNMLQDHCDPYDTLKLFKQKSKAPEETETISDRKDSSLNASITGSADDISILESSSEQNTLELFSGIGQVAVSCEKPATTPEEAPAKVKADDIRVHGESISDRSDPLHQYLNEEEDAFYRISPTGQSLSVADLPLLNKFKKSLDDTILSFSPYLKFTIPYLETEPGRNCILRRFFPKEIFYSPQFLDKVEGIRTSVSVDASHVPDPSSELKLKPPHPLTLAKIASKVDTREVQALLSHFRACGSRLNRTNNVILEKRDLPILPEIKETIWPDCLDPASHQRLPVLFCSYSHNTNDAPASFCVNPWVVNMDLYGRNDIALGRFLERYCLTTEYKCPAPSCRAQIAQHGRRFAHDGGCLQITLNQMSNDPFGQENVNQILMWSKCVECKNVSPVVPMSSDTWSLSFAKYLELRFHGNVYMNRSSETCQHSLHHDHYQYFSKGDMLAVFKYTKIKLLEISLPPPLINITYDVSQHANVIDEVKTIALKGDDVFSTIKEKLATLQIELDSLNAMKQQVAKDQSYFKAKIEEIQMKLTSPTLENKRLEGKTSARQVQNLMFRIEDGLVILKRLISEAVFNWNLRISEVAKKKDERPRRFGERSLTGGSSGLIDTDGYITEDTASESQMEDLSPMSADYNAIDAISAVHQHSDAQHNDILEHSDGEIQEGPNPADIVIIQGSPKMHQRSHSDVLPMSSEDVPDRRKKKKTILSQLLPSASSVSPIVNPLGALEHHLLPLGSVVPIVVYESEPSSIIAYALDSHDYKHAFQEIPQVKSDQSSSPLNKRKFVESKETVLETTQSGEFKRPSVLSFLRGASPSPASPSETERSISAADGNPQGGSQSEIDEDREKRAIKQQNYIEVQFADATTNFYCRIYFAAQFAALRESVLPCGEDGFTRSLCRSVQWAARGGKSGSTFCKTRDDRFILKEMSRMEMQIFLDFAPNYFAYMEKCQQTKQPTLLGKIVGVYRVSFKNNTTNNALRTIVLVMENLFYDRIITDKFDLKGSVRNRLVNPEDIAHEGELVLMDENLLNMSCDSPLYIRPHSKAVLNKAIEQDTKFLADNSVMDYSLLVGLEPKSGELVLGIIDYIRTFTWDKKLETMVKKSGILGGQGKLPTIVSPEEYRERFIAAMHRYFLPVPDRWTGLGRGVESP